MLKNELCHVKVILTVFLSQPRTNRELERCAKIHSRRYLISSAYRSTAGSVSVVWHHSKWIRNFENVGKNSPPPPPNPVDVQTQAVCPTKVRKWEETNIKKDFSWINLV
jgi:hypothetical protein